MFKSMRADIQRITKQIRAGAGGNLTLVLIGSADFSEDGRGDLPCAGYSCRYPIAGRQQCLFFPADAEQAAALARAISSYANKIDQPGSLRPGVVLMHCETVPNDAVMIQPLPNELSVDEYAAQIYRLLESAE